MLLLLLLLWCHFELVLWDSTTFILNVTEHNVDPNLYIGGWIVVDRVIEDRTCQSVDSESIHWYHIEPESNDSVEAERGGLEVRVAKHERLLLLKTIKRQNGAHTVSVIYWNCKSWCNVCCAELGRTWSVYAPIDFQWSHWAGAMMSQTGHFCVFKKLNTKRSSGSRGTERVKWLKEKQLSDSKVIE